MEPRGPDSLPKTGNSRGIQSLPGGQGKSGDFILLRKRERKCGTCHVWVR